MPRAQGGSQQGPSERGGPGGSAKQRQRPGQDSGPGPDGRQSRDKEEREEPRTYGRGDPVAGSASQEARHKLRPLRAQGGASAGCGLLSAPRLS